ncbi:MAG: hypothetical protein ACK4TD_23300, partial [Ectopseudomonas guguanensis]
NQILDQLPARIWEFVAPCHVGLQPIMATILPVPTFRTEPRGYRQRFNNLAVHIEAVSNPRWWAGYCTKEHEISADILKKARRQRTVPDYASDSARDGGKTLYESVGELFSEEA